jgi:hypothetical protein
MKNRRMEIENKIAVYYRSSFLSILNARIPLTTFGCGNTLFFSTVFVENNCFNRFSVKYKIILDIFSAEL